MPDVLKFSSAEVDIVLHATEDRGKVLASIENTLAVPAVRFSEESSEGHFGNKIVRLKARVTSEEAAILAARIMSVLNSIDRQKLTDDIEEYSDEKGNLFLRFHKQRICQGRVSLAESDSVRVKFRPVRRYRPSDNVKAYRGLLSLD
jgi:RNA-binding protein